MATAPTTNDASETNSTRQLPTVRGWFGRSTLGWTLWLLNITLLLWLVAWVAFDERSALTVDALQSQLLVRGSPNPAALQFERRVVMIVAVCGLAAFTALGIFFTLFAGAETHRRLRSWFAFTMLVAAWLTMSVGWRELAWQGQRIRLWSDLNEFKNIATQLQADWPTGDGKQEGLGTFMAYPHGKPRMLMMLISDTSPRVSAVERADNGALAFEFAGDNRGTWLEWHPPSSAPRNFMGGLEGEYDLRRASPLGSGWYLVRYRERG